MKKETFKQVFSQLKRYEKENNKRIVVHFYMTFGKCEIRPYMHGGFDLSYQEAYNIVSCINFDGSINRYYDVEDIKEVIFTNIIR